MAHISVDTNFICLTPKSAQETVIKNFLQIIVVKARNLSKKIKILEKKNLAKFILNLTRQFICKFLRWIIKNVHHRRRYDAQ
mgnify:CR=1 FL=1